MKPRKNYRQRPKKSGARKRQRVLAQKKRLLAAGYTEDELHSMSTVEIRENLKKASKKKAPKKETAKPKKKAKKKTAAKKPAKKTTKKK